LYTSLEIPLAVLALLAIYAHRELGSGKNAVVHD
jgi:hypothetical protein